MTVIILLSGPVCTSMNVRSHVQITLIEFTQGALIRFRLYTCTSSSLTTIGRRLQRSPPTDCLCAVAFASGKGQRLQVLPDRSQLEPVLGDGATRPETVPPVQCRHRAASIEDVVELNAPRCQQSCSWRAAFFSFTEGWIGGNEMCREDLARLLLTLLAVSRFPHQMLL